MKKITTYKKSITYTTGILFIIIFASIGVHILTRSHAATSSAPTSPPVQICGNTSVLSGPATAPSGAVTVAAGNDSSVNLGQANTTYWFAPGTHTLGTGEFSQIDPGTGSTYEGAPGAILDGQDDNNFAFVGGSTSVTNVTIKYLTIQNFTPPGSQGAVNTNSNDGWTIEYDTIQDNLPGSAMMMGSNNTIEYNCLTQNGQYAFNGYQVSTDPESSTVTHGPKNVNVSDNEISYNNTCNWEAAGNFPITSPAKCSGAGQFGGCGCSGGGKFWQVDQATYVSNYVHNNYGVGVWPDTNNNGFDIEGNYFSNNFGQAIIYEISYNALIKDNTFINNAWGGGASNTGFPDTAIYISESGGDTRVPGAYSGSLDITGNLFTNNWGGIAVWENANRYCSSSANSSSGDCTLVNSAANMTTCANAADLATTPYINDCRWKSQNVSVTGNTFNFDPTTITGCAANTGTCGFNGLFSEYGSYAPYTGFFVPLNISNDQNNTFADNTYTGPWKFMGFTLGDQATWQQWSTGFNDQNGSGDHFNAQDAGSTYNSQSSPAPQPTTKPTAPTNVNAKASSATSVTISWAASTDTGGPGLGGYYVFRNGTQIASVGASVTNYVDTSVSPDTAYSYAIEAYDTSNPVNTSSLSTPGTVTTPSTGTAPTNPSPAAPTNVMATANSPTSVTVNWTPSTGDGGSGTVGTIPTPDSAVNCNYTTDTWGDSTDVKSDNYTATNASSSNGNPASFSVQLNANKGVTQVVGYPSNQCILYSAMPSVLSSSYNVTPPAASTGLDYEYAYDIWLNSATNAKAANWSGDQELMIWTYVNGQRPFGSVKGTLTDGSQVWAGSAGQAVSVVLPQNETSGTVNIANIVSQLESGGYIPTSDNGIMDVEYGIEAPYGGGQTFVVNSLSLSETSSTSSSSNQGSGSTPTIAGYYVLRNGVNITPNMVSGSSYTDNSVVANTSYTYTVEAVDSSKNVSSPSNAATVKTPNPQDTTPPTQPTGLTASAASTSQINLAWNASTDNVGVAGYYVYRNGTQIATVTTTSYGDTGLNASTAYNYYVVAFDGAGNKSTASTTVSATTKAPTATPMQTIEGKVTNSRTHAVVSGVYVHTGPIATPTGPAFTYTNSKGEYVLNNIRPNMNHYYRFTHSGFNVRAFYKKFSGTGAKTINTTLIPRKG